MRVRNAHSAEIDGHAPGAMFDVDPEHPGFAPLLKAGQLVPATASDVRFGPNDPPPSQAAVRELVAGVNARNREINDLHDALAQLSRQRDEAGEGARALQSRVNELEALLALRTGAPVEEGAIAAAVREAEAALTERFDRAYSTLQGSHAAALAENAKLKGDLEGLLSAAPAAAAEPAKPPKPAKNG